MPLSLGLARKLRAGQRAAAAIHLVRLARIHEPDPYAYPIDELARPPTPSARRIDELQSHRWRSAVAH